MLLPAFLPRISVFGLNVIPPVVTPSRVLSALFLYVNVYVLLPSVVSVAFPNSLYVTLSVYVCSPSFSAVWLTALPYLS